MKANIEGGAAFGHVHIDLEPGESMRAESDAMASMATDLDMKAVLNGGFFSALGKKLFGGESLFINHFSNHTDSVKRVTLAQATPGEIRELSLMGNRFCFQPGAYLASTPGVRLGLKWAGPASWIGGEGLFKLEVSGRGSVWYGAYGGLVEKDIDGEYIVDTSHLVGYEPQMKLHVRLSGGIFSSMFSGEGLVTRVSGRGKILIQTRSLSGFRGWLNPKIY